MKSIIAFALFVVFLAQVECTHPAPCAKQVYYTEDLPVGYSYGVEHGYPLTYEHHEGLVYPHGYHPYPYTGHSSCKCSKCYPSLYTQQYRDCKSYF